MNLRSTAFAAAASAAVLLLATFPTRAQEATPGAAPKPRAAASAATPGMGMHRNNTPGWAMMTRQERDEHHRTMMGMKDHGACSTYMQEHHAKMVDRAKERGRAMPATPPQDGCAWLKR